MVPTVLLFALVCSSSSLHVSDSDSVRDRLHFRSWMTEHNKVYSREEYHKRLQIFTENKRRIDKHNEGNHSYTMALNQFSDMTFAEFGNTLLWTTPQNCSATKGNYVRSNKLLPDSFDWRKEGNYVTDVKDQRSCGSCWTFSTTGCLESVIAIKSEKLTPLSEQQLVDCAQDFNNHGCNGGLPSQAFEYIRYSEGLMTETDYPYKAVEGTCQYKPKLASAVVKDVVNITEYLELDMVDAVATHNPVSFAFEVTEDFMHYSQGVYTSTECHNTTDKVNHAVLAVGYSTNSPVPYWIVKNSWSSSWGMKGYFLIELGKNMCGLAACSSFPVV